MASHLDTNNPNAITTFTEKQLSSAGGVESQKPVPANTSETASVPLITEKIEIPPPVLGQVTPKSARSAGNDLALATPKTVRSIPVPGVPPAPELVHVFVATFQSIERNTGKISTHIVEVPHTQNPTHDQKVAWGIIRAKLPKAGPNDIRRTAGRILSRPGGASPVIVIRDGETIRQLFPDRTEFEAARTVGTVIFEGALCDVILRHLRSRSACAVTLRQPGGTVINFSEQFTTNRLSVELPKIIAEIIGSPGQTLKLFFHKST
jgi:hypothetical protein